MGLTFSRQRDASGSASAAFARDTKRFSSPVWPSLSLRLAHHTLCQLHGARVLIRIRINLARDWVRSNTRKSAMTAFKDADEDFANHDSREEQNNDETSCSIGVAIRGD